MDPKKLPRYQTKLQEIRTNLVGDVAKNLKSTQQDSPEPIADITDEAAKAYSRQLMLDLGEQDWQKLKQVEEALEKINQGDYGVCSICEEPIPEARLEVVPFAQHCVECLSKIEENKENPNSGFDNLAPAPWKDREPGDREL
ncbi:MAG: TraR/DksA family transcriptional regulator [Nitrospinaceae bacterium]